MRRLAPLAVALIVLLLCGCGGDTAGTGSDSAAAPPVEHRDSGDAAERFKGSESDNSIQEFGEEADAAELTEAAAALHGYLDATARGDWEAACRFLAKSIPQRLAMAMGAGEANCPTLLEAFFARTAPAAFVEAASADVSSFRVGGDHGFVLYHGAKQVDLQMPMAREGERWKVAAVAGTPLP
jgi:hypothetical protein